MPLLATALSCLAAAAPPPPPYGLPPWSPGAAPPIPGPVFSPAFKALLVLMVFGGGYVFYTVRSHIQKMREAGELGDDNAVLTSATPGAAEWMRSVQQSRGRAVCKAGRAGGAVAPRPKPTKGVGVAAEGGKKGKKGAKGKEGRRRRKDEEDEEDEAQEMLAVPRPKPKTMRAGGAKGTVTEMAAIKPAGRRKGRV